MKFITSLGPGGWEEYGKRLATSFAKHVPWGLLVVYVHDCPLPTEVLGNVSYVSLDVPQLKEFKTKFAAANGTDGGKQPYNFRRDAVKFANKVFAIATAATEEFVWIDGDTEFTADVPEEEFLALFPPECDIAYLGRSVINYAETSFILFRATQKSGEFIQSWVNLYTTGEVFTYQEWHDGFLFQRLLISMALKGFKAWNLTPEVKDLDAFGVSPIAKWAKHYKGNKKNQAPQAPEKHLLWIKTPSGVFSPIRVFPKDAAPKDVIAKNVETHGDPASHTEIKTWIERAAPHGRKAVLVASGPSLVLYLEKIKRLQEEGAYISCVKHAFPKLLEAGIVPDACVVLDARPAEGISTHGVVRTDLLKDADSRTVFFVASMTSVEMTKFIKSKGCPIVGWHALTAATMEWSKNKPNAILVAGGTCSIIRSVGLFHTLGFRDFEIYGVDASRVDAPSKAERERLDDRGNPWWLEAKAWRPDSPTYWTSGEMLALAQDIVELANLSMAGNHRLRFFSPLLAGAIWGGFPEIPFIDNWEEVIQRAREGKEDKTISVEEWAKSLKEPDGT